MDGPAIFNCSAISPAAPPPTVHPAPPGPIPNRRFYRLHLAPALIRTRGQQRGSQRRTRSRRLGCPSNDVITPLAEHDQRASPSVLPVRAPRAAMEPRARQREPQHRCRLGIKDGDRDPRSRARARARHHMRMRGRSARSSRSHHHRRPICAVPACVAPLAPWRRASTRIAAGPAAACHGAAHNVPRADGRTDSPRVHPPSN
jgi:hypothetical protein